MPRNRADQPLASDADEALGRALYEKEAGNWPAPLGWDKLPDGSKYQWVKRATKGHK